MRAILTKIILLELLFAPMAFAMPFTPSECRNYCETGPTGYCLGLGTSAKRTTAPYIALIESAQSQSSGVIVDACNLKISVSGDDLTVNGSDCSIVDKSPFSDLTMTTEFHGESKAKIGLSSDNFQEIIFSQNLPSFKLVTSSGNFSGPVTFVTANLNSSGEKKVVWSNGELCFSGFVEP